MTRYRYLDGMGDVVAEEEFEEHAEALAWIQETDELDELEHEVNRVEFLGPEGDWRWAGAVEG